MKIAELLALKEDWGSSDWYPVIRGIEKALMDGHSLEDAAADQADRYYADMGYETPEDAVPSIIAKFNRLQAHAPKHEPKPSDAHVNESTDHLECAIRDNWMSVPVSKIVKTLKAKVKAGEKEWQYLSGKSDEELEDLVDDAKYQARNQYESLQEGMWVVKSKDGVEKRFKDVDSAEAKAWKEKTAKKAVVPKEKFSAEWWDYHWNKDDGFSDKLFPWTKISRDTVDSKAIEAAVKDAGFSMKNVDDFTIGKAVDKKIGGVDCAGVVVRVSYSFTKDDDMGIDSDEPVSDAQSIYVARDPKNPAKLIFAGYAH